MKYFFRFFLGVILFAALLLLIAFAVLPLPGTVPVLMYHFLGSQKDAQASKNFITEKSFSRQMDFLHRFGYRVISLEEYYEIRKGARKPRGREIVLTFDDGNETFPTTAYPILKKHRFPVTLFLVSESVKRGINGSMVEQAIKELLSNSWISIASHTRTHPFLSQMSEDQIHEELFGSKADLQKMFGRPIGDLSYPSGDFDRRVMEIAKTAGYRMAFTTSVKKLKGIPEGDYAILRQKISRTSDNLFIFWFNINGIYQLYKTSAARHKT